MTDTAPVAPATPAPAAPSAAAADLTLLPPAEAAVAARQQINALKSDGDFIKAYLSNDVNAVAKLRGLHEIERNAATGVQFGAQTQQEQRNQGADYLAEKGLPPEAIQHYREGKPVSADEYRMAYAKKQSLFDDPNWRTKYFNNDHEARMQLSLLQVILSSRVAV